MSKGKGRAPRDPEPATYSYRVVAPDRENDRKEAPKTPEDREREIAAIEDEIRRLRFQLTKLLEEAGH